MNICTRLIHVCGVRTWANCRVGKGSSSSLLNRVDYPRLHAHANIQAPKVSKKKQVKASLGQVGKAAKKVNLGGYGEDDDLGADFDDFM